ncbi:glycosyltransferase [Caballeronia sp. LjRoot29]|uniref:glycosyltransferase n=1 Tax=Caballeronia sp. LjRoot29 TaxID=3342315 RepID=UPI003ECD78D5
MKLLIFTPTVRASAIGRMAALVSHALIAQQHEVVIVRTERELELHSLSHDFGAKIIAWNDERRVLEAAAACDVAVYQIGDNYHYHEGGVAWLARLPGVVCLHDFFVGHLFYEWAKKNMENADAILKRWYGDEVAQRFFKFSSSETFIEYAKDNAPLTEWIGSLALSVITHSHWGTRRIAESCAGSVRVVPLAYDAPGALGVASSYEPNKYGRVKLLTIGHINRNKRVANVIQAIASSPRLRQNVVYRLVGHISPDMAFELTALANCLNVNLVISGEADAFVLAHAIGQADIVSCLRWPSLEAASASAIEAMLYGKATIVTDTGFYTEIPEDCVARIANDDEITNVRTALEALYSAPEARIAMGERAQRWASLTYSAENYAKQLVEESVASQRARPIVTAKAYFVGLMKRWGASEQLLSAKETVSSLRVMG